MAKKSQSSPGSRRRKQAKKTLKRDKPPAESTELPRAKAEKPVKDPLPGRRRDVFDL